MYGIKLEINDERLKNKVRVNHINNAESAKFRIKFTEHLDKATTTNSNIKIVNSRGKEHITDISYDVENKSVVLKPKEPYSADAEYYLIIGTGVVSSEGRHLISPLYVKFIIKENKIILLKTLKPSDPALVELSSKTKGIFPAQHAGESAKKKRRIFPILLFLLLALGAGGFAFFSTQVGGNFIDGAEVFAKYVDEGYDIQLLHEHNGTTATRMAYNAQRYTLRPDAYKFYFYNEYAIDVYSITINIMKDGVVFKTFDVPESIFSGKQVSEFPIFTFDFKKGTLKLHF